MTLSTTTARVSYAANGATASFAFGFKIWAAANLKVYLRDNATLTDTLQTLNTDYTVDTATYPGTGNVVFAVPPATGRTVVILRDMPLTQDLDLVASGAFAAENVETQLDKLAAEIQTLRELITRSPRFGVGSTLGELKLPEPRPAVANQLLGVTSSGDGFDLKAPADLPLQTVSSFISTLLDDPDAETARATLEIEANLDLNLLTNDFTGGAHNDLVAFMDASEGFASNKIPVDVFFANVIAVGTNVALGGSDQANFRVLTRRDSDGVLRKTLISGIGAGKQTIWIPAGAMIARTSNGPAAGLIETAANKVMIKTLDFDASTWEYAQFSLRMPKSWDEGNFGAAFVWSHGSAVTNFNVVWGIQGTAYSDNEPLDVSFGATATVTDTGGTADRVYMSPQSAAFSVAGPPSENDLVIFQVQRAGGNVDDTLAVDARLHGVMLTYTTNANTDD